MPTLDTIAERHNIPLDAAQHLLDALVRGGGRMAQFSHPALGGMGQWHNGGMMMIGDMFNDGLKARVSALCTDLVPLVADAKTPTTGAPAGWWPAGLGHPSTAGSQNDARYAYFPDARRLAIESEGRVKTYDTGEHRISGVSQQQGAGSDLSFSSQLGQVRVHDLPEAAPSNEAPQKAHAEPTGQSGNDKPHEADARAVGSSKSDTPSARANTGHEPSGHNPSALSSSGHNPPGHDHLGVLERLSELHKKGVLTNEEFATKKTEILSRL